MLSTWCRKTTTLEIGVWGLIDGTGYGSDCGYSQRRWLDMTLKASWRALMTQVTRTFVGNLAPHSSVASVARELEPTSNEPGA